MLDFTGSSPSAPEVFGPPPPNAAAPHGSASSRCAARDKQRDTFADQLDASLARSEDSRGARPADDAEASASPHDATAAPSEAGDAAADVSQTSISDDAEENIIVAAALDATMPQQYDNVAPMPTDVIALPVALDLATSATETDEDTSQMPDEIVEALPSDDATPVGIVATKPQPPTAAAKKADTGVAQQRLVTANLVPADDLATTPETTSNASQTQPTEMGEAPIEIGEPTAAAAAAATTSTGSFAAPEPESRTQATGAIAIETAFDQRPDDQREPSSDTDAKAGTSRATMDQREAPQGAKAQLASAFDLHVANADARSIPTMGQGAMASHRLAQFEAAANALETAGFTHTPAADTPERIVQSLRMQFQRGGGDAIVHIKPEHLGPLTISLRVENGTVSARVIADNPVAAEWLQANEHTLRDGLKANGLQLDRLVINRDQDPSSRTPHRESPESRRGQHRRFDARQSTFAVTV